MKTPLLLVMLAFTSCGKAPEMPQHQKAEPLVHKSREEVLKLKYSEAPKLNCSLWSSKSRNKNLPEDSFSWSITEDHSLLRVLGYKSQNKETIVAVKLPAPLEFMDRISYTYKEKEYAMEHSPVLKILFRRAAKTVLSNGTVHDKQSFSETSLYENIETTLFALTITEENGSSVTEELKCKLQTFIKEPYSHQWQIVK